MKSRTIWFLSLSALLLSLLGGFGFSQARHGVGLNITLDGRPTDAQIKVYQGNELVAVVYTDVHELGKAQFQLSTGDYRFLIDHGGGFTSEVLTKEITVQGALELRSDLRRLYEPNDWGYYSADTHAHTAVSPDGTTPVDQAVGVQLAADLDVAFISDHNSVRGHGGFATTAGERGVPYLLSEEVTTDFSIVNMGHFNVYSLSPGELVDWRLSPTKMFRQARDKGTEVIQINHPKSGGSDYFDLLDDPRWDPGFDVAEVYNGEFSPEDELAVAQMFAFWSEGKRYAAVAVSDDHIWTRLDVEYGRPRTYVFVAGEPTAEAWMQGLLAGHAFVTYGPLIELRANGEFIPGDTVTLAVGESITLEAKLRSVVPLERTGIIKNGEVVAELPLDGNEDTLSFEDVPESDGWYAVRVFAENGDRALTNPIWIEVE